MGEKRKPGGGRKKLKPNYDASKLLKEQMESAAALYEEDKSLQSIADELELNPIKVRKLLITAGVYESEIADQVQSTFNNYRETQDYKTAVTSTMSALNLSRASVTSYLPYEKGLYFSAEESAEKISVGAERQRRMRKRNMAVDRLITEQIEEALWDTIIAFQGYKFRTYSGLPFSYELKKARSGEYRKELFIDRRENSKSLAWSSIALVFGKTQGRPLVERPKALGDIRGVSQHICNVLSLWPD
ncbi:MAG: hypothetical protein Q4F41_18465 [Eubacteriales bacterium]|nr:hypothetical protein [Eubacteriales bacterium]